ncbi:hypothetical protein OR60_16535 [Xanthomonas vesicatoria]|uniref:Uncharacterized protein n=3 Tax=Xanthomonas vesicatoria TaxID=56460 RepID=A0AAJ0J2J7_9XANT|nr:hypothetical protein BI313_13580 [Xanthomonas vesicatoria]KHM92492.1 hypothetical protein OR60_16535 [Xanthomonas vesicatoria]KHM98564.1 hypothetical protein OR61_01095 [Xanthomonas vesicatoria]KTF33822.1 hypothetical protein LMG919_15880 [Xanthomonas vesicatoria]
MIISTRSTPHAPTVLPHLAMQAAANDSEVAPGTPWVQAAEFRCGRTGIRNRDIWCALPDIRSAHQTHRLQRWATRSVLFTAAGALFALALVRLLLH